MQLISTDSVFLFSALRGGRMVLKKLSIFGFKSFADKTEIVFGEGLTAVIGPNGCGKSNVVDAIRWVFGEQKASMLRSASMQEVIFSGTQRRQPLNMAEVTLTIHNTQGILPTEYREVAITRQIYRSGESEYRINRTPCRLRDIHNLFMDTGIGSNVYTTIENGMINKILSDKAEERRILFEEAAGIGKYKNRIRESQRKLDRTRQDLLRINDRVQEKDRYVRMLARQVEKAKRFKQYRDDLMALEVGFENRRYTSYKQQIGRRQASLAELEQEYETLRARIAANESKIEKMEIAKVEKENDLQIASQNVSSAGEKINTIDREISMANQSLAFLRENVSRFESEAESLGVQMEEKRQLVSQIENSVIERESQLQEHTTRVDGAQNELAEFDARVSGYKEQVDDLVQQQFSLVQGSGDKQRELSACQTHLANCIERCERDKRELHNLETRVQEYREALDLSKAQLQVESEAHKNHLQAREVLWQRIEKEEVRYHEFVENEKRLEAKIDGCKAQLRFLEGLEASFAGYDTGVKTLLTKKLEGARGIVADLIEVRDSEVVGLVERALGSSLQTVVFETEQQLKTAVNVMQNERNGSARMVSLERLNALTAPSTTCTADALTSMRAHVQTAEECRGLADHFFNAVYIADSAEAAFSVHTGAVDTTIVARDGLVCNGHGVLMAGKQKKEEIGILQRKQEREKLAVDITRFQSEYEKVVHEKEICIINRDEAKRALVEVDEKINRGRQKQQEQETSIRHYENEIQNIFERIEGLRPELSKSQKDIASYESLIVEHETALARIGDSRKDLEGQIESAKDRLAEMEQERLRLAEHLKNVELAMHGLKNRIEQDKSSIERLNKDIKQFSESRQQKSEEKSKALASISDFEQKLVYQDEALKAAREQRDEREKVLSGIREQYNGVLNQIEEIRKEVREDQRHNEIIANKKHGLEVEQTRDQEQCRAIRERIYNGYEIDLESPPEQTPLMEEDIEGVTENIQMLKERLRRVGDVNMGALQEFETENGELQSLVTQRDDLQTAVDDLERAIRKLNREARQQFVATFEQVQSNFTEMFTTLFEGGEAYISLDENADPLEAAISINVRPAGKKMRGVTLLSGGERALTAISLLFALYMVKPSAYCVLDELDAPLDDANVDRFLRILRKFSEKTQFIIITHNKRTMEASDLLYGVTQQESGVSVIASVNMHEIERQAA